MKHQFLEPIKVGNQVLKNRIFYMAMAKTLSGLGDSKVTVPEVNYVKSIAQGGTAMMVFGATVIDDQWPSRLPGQPGIYDDSFLPGLKRVVEVAHENDMKILFQLWHPGAVNYSGVEPPTVNDISVDEIHRIQGKYVDAAKRSMAAGADGIEFQMCHTYLANQFMSPLWNHRTDEYGCDTVENGARFAVETIKMIREVIGPDKILAVKLQGFDFPEGEGPDGNDGIQPELAAKYAVCAEQAGADMLTVSAGGTLTGKDDIMSGDVHRAEGWKVAAARKVKDAVSIPVAASGNIRHPEYVDEIMANGDCDMVGMARGLFAEREWVNKCAAGKEDQLRYCISCMNCWNLNPFAPDDANCSVNPFARREGSRRELEVNGDGRVVAIVGAGPAGMEAAVTLKQRGFEPVVFELENRIGGNIHIAKKPPFKGKFDWACGYYNNMARDLEIDVRLNTEASVENILALNPYSILIAAGSNVTVPPVEGLEGENVIQSREVLDKDMVFENKKMVVLGGGITGMETALYLKAQGNTVELVDFAPEIVQGDPRFMEEAKLEGEHCAEKGIPMHYNTKALKFADGKLYVEGVNDGVQSEIEADIVVLSTGVSPNAALFDALRAAGHPSVWKVGDANHTGKIVYAVQSGSKFGYALQ